MRQPRILAIDDTPVNLQVLTAALDEQYDVQVATSGALGLAAAAKAPPDLILLDVMMPEMDGFEVCRRLKANPALSHIPVIFITAMSDHSAESRGLVLGAVDYISKPIRVDIAKLRIGNALEREVLRQRLERIAHYDTLTKLPNRVLLADRMTQAMTQTQRRGQHLSVAFLDLDGFKAVNDTHGHAAGDFLLVTVAKRMREALRDGDTLARLGGDEFVVVLLDLADIVSSAPILNRLLQAVVQPVQFGLITLQVSASLGVTFYPQAQEMDADQLLHQADQAMYQVKQSGKNRFHVFNAEQDRSVRQHHESM
jgi:diguanylate cyclase (GGDEF)-like protein